MKNKIKTNENGRSMIEMLGVLAIIGVLSVGGIAGYTSAMNKHRANELLNQISMRATSVMAQVEFGNAPNVDDFGTYDGYKFTAATNTANANQFTITISEKTVPEAVCNNMKNAVGSSTPIRNINANCTVITYNNDMGTTVYNSDYNGDPDHCPGKYCTGSNTCVDTGAACTCSGTTPTCKVCDTDTGSIVNATDGTECTGGTCQSGTCETAPSCSDTVGDPCIDNSTVCPGYYCSIAGGTIGGSGEGCGTDTYTPGSGSVAALGTPNTKGGYKASPSPVASWDAAVNYCAALGRDGLVTQGRLANVPSECSMSNYCSALPDDNYYWLNGLVQCECNYENYSTTYGSISCNAFYVNYGSVLYGPRNDSGNYALCG